MLATILSWLAGGGIAAIGKQLTAAYKAKLDAKNDEDRLKADVAIQIIEARLEGKKEQAKTIREGMQHKVFWIPWLIATVPLTVWFAWGVTDSTTNGALPDTAELTPQLMHFAEAVWQSLFYSGAGVATVQSVGGVVKSVFKR